MNGWQARTQLHLTTSTNGDVHTCLSTTSMAQFQTAYGPVVGRIPGVGTPDLKRLTGLLEDVGRKEDDLDFDQDVQVLLPRQMGPKHFF